MLFVAALARHMIARCYGDYTRSTGTCIWVLWQGDLELQLQLELELELGVQMTMQASPAPTRMLCAGAEPPITGREDTLELPR